MLSLPLSLDKRGVFMLFMRHCFYMLMPEHYVCRAACCLRSAARRPRHPERQSHNTLHVVYAMPCHDDAAATLLLFPYC